MKRFSGKKHEIESLSPSAVTVAASLYLNVLFEERHQLADLQAVKTTCISAGTEGGLDNMLASGHLALSSGV